MDDSVERIYCCDRGNNDVLTAILANNRSNDLAAAMMNGGGFGGNNAWWLLFLLLLGNRGWNNCGNGVNTEFSLLQDQAQQNQNTNLLREAMRDNFSAIQQLAQSLNCDFNTLQQCCCDLKSAITQVSGQVGYSAEKVINAVNLGDLNIIQQLKDCCCTTQKEIIKMGYEQQLATSKQTGELRNGQRDLGQAITEGFSKVGYQQAADKCEIIRAGQDNTRLIIDTLRGHWSDEQAREIQDLKNKISQFEQTDAIFARLRTMGYGNNCGCNNGCNNGCGY